MINLNTSFEKRKYDFEYQDWGQKLYILNPKTHRLVAFVLTTPDEIKKAHWSISPTDHCRRSDKTYYTDIEFNEETMWFFCKSKGRKHIIEV